MACDLKDGITASNRLLCAGPAPQCMFRTPGLGQKERASPVQRGKAGVHHHKSKSEREKTLAGRLGRGTESYVSHVSGNQTPNGSCGGARSFGDMDTGSRPAATYGHADDSFPFGSNKGIDGRSGSHTLPDSPPRGGSPGASAAVPLSRSPYLLATTSISVMTI